MGFHQVASNEVNKVPLEPVYSGKMLYGLYELIKKRDFFPQNSRIMVIHGGGLQGKQRLPVKYPY